jgi:hypothetical protein
MNLPYAEEIGHYWQTSKTQPDSWIDKAERIIQQHGGYIMERFFGSVDGREGYVLAFAFEDDHFRIAWPVLPTKSGNRSSARIQATTMLYHDVKAKCMTSVVLGNRIAFFSYLMLPDGRSVMQLADPELQNSFPKLLVGN